jgi:hypothetical protein
MKRFRIGRADTNEIVLSDPSVSREHAEVVKMDRGTFLLRDLGSTYGTSVRLGVDWHLVTTENVTYTTPIRIGEFETTVAGLLQELDPLAVYRESVHGQAWMPPEPRLSPEERAQQPETLHAGWGPGNEPPLLFAQEPAPRRIGARRPLVLLSLIGLGAMLVAAFLRAASALG